MVQLSPKALRFAERAAKLAADRHVLADDELQLLANWRTEQHPGLTDIPRATAAMFLHAIDELTSQGFEGEQPFLLIDDGNDLEFFKDIKQSLKHGLLLAGARPGFSQGR